MLVCVFYTYTLVGCFSGCKMGGIGQYVDVGIIPVLYVQYKFLGTYLGYRKSPKYREWTTDLTEEDLKKIEVGSNCADDLAKALFIRLFKCELEEKPNDICATFNRLEVRQLCDPVKMHAIRCKYIQSSFVFLRVTKFINALQCMSTGSMPLESLEETKKVRGRMVSAKS